MKLGMQVGFRPGHIVLDGDPDTSSPKGIGPPMFDLCLLSPDGCVDQDATKEVGLGPGHIVLDGDLAPLPQKGAEPPIFGPYLLWPNGWMDQDATWKGSRPQPKRHCVRWGPSSPSPKGFSAHVYSAQTAGWIKMALGTEVGFGPATLR